MSQQSKGFTLVELVVVITILSILWTVALLAFRGYSVDARNSKRITDLNSIKNNVTEQIANSQNLLNFVTVVYDNMIPATSASIGWTTPAYGVNYKAWFINYAPLNLIQEDFSDPKSQGAYVIWATTAFKGNAYQIASTLEPGDDGLSHAYVIGTYKPRASTATTGYVTAWAIWWNGTYNQNIFTINNGVYTGVLKVNDTVTWVPAFTSPTTRKITKISQDGLTVTLDTGITNALSANMTTISLAATESIWLIDEWSTATTGTNTIVVNDGTNLPYAFGGCTPSYTSSVFWTTGTSPSWIFSDSYGNVYTANSLSNNVSKITPGGSSSILWTTGTYPLWIIWDSSWNIYTSNDNVNNISKITPSGTSTIIGSTPSSADGIAIDLSWNLFIACWAGTVTKITPSGVVSTFWSTWAAPWRIITDSLGNVYTSNNGTNNVTKITAAWVSSTLWTTWNNPTWITIDWLGNIYVWSIGTSSITKITSSGVSSTLWSTGAAPYGVTIDNLWNVFAANYNSNTVTKITQNWISTTVGSTGNNPRGIAIDTLWNLYTANSASNTVTKLTYECN